MFNYTMTHVSVNDQSTAMVVFQTDENITLVNEEGFVWTDPLNQWQSI